MRIEEIMEKMSLKDKIAMCSGKNNWRTKSFKKYNISEMMMSDGHMDYVNKVDQVMC